MSGPVLVPTIDFGGFEGPDSVAHARVVSQLATACQDVGFFLVVNHGIDETVLSDALSVSRCFFHLPLRQKMRVANTKKGYIPVGGCENAVRPSSLHEKFSCGPVDFDKTDEYYAGTDGDPRAELFFGEPNLWPSEPTSFERKYAKYYRECTEFTARLHRGFAEALGVPTDYFESKSTKHVSNLVALRYPPVADAERTQKEKTRTSPEDTQTRLLVKPHTDPTDLTVLLFEHGPCGLQVLPDGAGETWVDVPAVKNSLLVNLGDATQFWTNDVWRSTRHRVAVDEETHKNTDRMSLVFFHAPNYDTVVDARELSDLQTEHGCDEGKKVISDTHGRPQKYEPFQYANRTHFAQLGRNDLGLPDRQVLGNGNERGL